jgi:outer membrane lipoprotein-sorting protein
MSSAGSSFYVTGGTLQQDAPCYVERQADRDLFDGLLKGEFCYVLTSRQMGKSSLMVRTSNKLRVKGINVAALDLTAIGQNLTPEQWYDGLALRLGRQLKLEDEFEDFWKKNERVSPVQRFFSALRDIAMPNRPGPLVLFVDEIDTVRSLPFSTDEFFSAIREGYNRRTEDPEFNRLTFCLLGVATPSDLIRDTRTTPFNIGRRIELNDFTGGEAAPLANGLGREPRIAATLLDRILYWTHGHPYLTQRLCQAVAEDARVTSPGGVDRLCKSLFLSHRARERDDNLLFVRERLLRSEAELASLLSLYEKVRAAKRVRDEETNVLAGILRLSGIARVVNGYLAVRNRIYAQVFDRKWVTNSMPNQELRRQREAFRKGILRGVTFATILVLAGTLLFRWVRQRIEDLQAQLAIQNLGATYHGLKSYEDHAVIRMDIHMQGARVVTSGLASIALEKPNKLNLRFKRQMGIGETDFQIVCDGAKLFVYNPLTKEYLVRDAQGSIQQVFDEVDRIPYVDIPEPLYQILASERPQQALAEQSRNVRVVGREEIGGRKAYIVRWGRDEASGSTAGDAPSTNTNASTLPYSVRAWVDQEDGVIRQIVQDLSGVVKDTLMPDLGGSGLRRVPLKGMIITTTHTGVRLNPEFRLGTFAFTPPPDARQVQAFESARRLAGRPVPEEKPGFDRSRLSLLIDTRAPQTRPELVDLSNHYNAPLTESWHSALPGNSLAPLPRGLQRLVGIEFDVRGIVQLAGQAADYLKSLYPESIKDIPVRHTCQRLHFLHGTGWTVADGTQIGSYRVRYANGDQRIVPIIYGFDVRDWWPQADESQTPNGLVVAWQGANEATRPLNRVVRIFKSVWANPLPEVEIASLDFVSAMTDSAPFLIAITAE